MSILERKTKRGSTWFAVFRWQGRQLRERADDKRAAQRLEKRRRAEVRAGTYTPPTASEALTFAEWARSWLDKRKTRTVSAERMWVESYVLTREWLAELPLLDLSPRHMVRLVTELQETTATSTGELLAPKSVANIYGAVRTMIRDARIEELVPRDPCVLPRGLLRRGTKKRRVPYVAEEAARLVYGSHVSSDARVFNALAFFTGCREGEICGLRWLDYDDQTRPLGCLSVERQYEGRPLKTSKAGQDRPRRVPVHPDLAAVLAWWRSEGFELVHRRKPQPSDPIVPSRKGEAYQRAAAYKTWLRSCAAADVENRSLHSTRHTFVTLARRGGARKDVLERVTHNASGDIVDAYTTWDWEPLCEAVRAVSIPTLASPDVDAGVDADSQVSEIIVEALGIEVGPVAPNREKRREIDVAPVNAGAQNHRDSRASGLKRSARQHPGMPGDDFLRVPPRVQAFVAHQLQEAMRYVHRPQRQPVLGPLRLAAVALDLGRIPPNV